MTSRNRRLRARSASQARQQARSRIFHSPGVGADGHEPEITDPAAEARGRSSTSDRAA